MRWPAEARRAALALAALTLISMPLAGGGGWLVWTAAAGGGAPAAFGPGAAIGAGGLVYAVAAACVRPPRLRGAMVAAGLFMLVLLLAFGPEGLANLRAAFGLEGAGAPPFAAGPGAVSAASTGLLVASGHALLVTAAATLAGYYCSRTPFSGRGALFAVLIAVQGFPSMTLLAPQFLLLHRLGLLDAVSGAVLALSALELPFAILFMKSAFDRIAPQLELCALADGAGRVEAFRDVALPLAAPAIAATATLSFILGWGDYVLTRIVFVSQERWTFSMYLHRLADENLGVDYGTLAMLALAYAAPPIVLIVLAARFARRAGPGGLAGLFE